MHLKLSSLSVAIAAVVVASSFANAGTVQITPAAFSGTESVVTFSNATDNKSGDPITVGGVNFDNQSSGNLYSGYFPNSSVGNRAIYFGKASDDGQLIDLVGQTNFTITFPSAVNRVGMELATGGTFGNTVGWSYEAFGTDNLVVGTGSVSASIVNLQNGTFIPNPVYATGSVFLGFESLGASIAKVRLFQTTNDANITIMDNLRFEAVESAVVPLPAAVWGGLLLLGGIGAKRSMKILRK